MTADWTVFVVAAGFKSATAPRQSVTSSGSGDRGQLAVGAAARHRSPWVECHAGDVERVSEVPGPASGQIARIARRARPLELPGSALVDRAGRAQGLKHPRLDVRRAAGPTTPLTRVRPLIILQSVDALARCSFTRRATCRHDCLTQLLASAYWWNRSSGWPRGR
jgi:hypothetical protein